MRETMVTKERKDELGRPAKILDIDKVERKRKARKEKLRRKERRGKGKSK